MRFCSKGMCFAAGTVTRGDTAGKGRKYDVFVTKQLKKDP